MLVIWSFFWVPGVCLAGLATSECKGGCTSWDCVPHEHGHECPHDPCRILMTIKIDNRRDEQRLQPTAQQPQTESHGIIPIIEADTLGIQLMCLYRGRSMLDTTLSIAYFQPLLL